MKFSLYSMAVDTFVPMLHTLSALLDKAGPPSVGEGTGVRLNHAKAAAFARVKDPNT